MQYYNVTLLSRGKRHTVLVKAENRKDAIKRAKLKTEGLILQVEEAPVPIEETLKELKKELFSKLSRRKIKRKDLIATIRQLAVMTNAGIPIYDSLKEIASNTLNEHLRLVLEDIAETVNAGVSFSDSLKRYETELGALTITMIRLGEQTGDMAHALFTLANILEEIDENVRKFKKAIRYPLITLGAMAIAFVILISYVVPQFKSFFAKLHADLPLPTKILLWLEHAFNTYGPAIIVGLFIISFFISYLYKTKKEFKYTIDKFLLKVYLIKDIIYFAQLNRFMLVFSELVKAGIPVVDALKNSVIMIDNSYIKERLSIVEEMVQKGASIQDAFRETGLFENMILQMIGAGEASGQLEAMLAKVTDYYGMKFNYILDNLSSYIEPVLLAIIAALVLLLALGIFLPMWDMARAVRH